MFRPFQLGVGMIIFGITLASTARALDLSLPIWYDTYVSSAATSSHCTSNVLEVRNDGTGVAYSYLTFNLSQIGDPALLSYDPMLNFFVESKSSGSLTVYIDALSAISPLCDHCITWAQRVNGSPANYGTIFSGGSVGITVPKSRLVDAVNAGMATVTFVMRCSTGYFTLDSSESGTALRRPSLVASYAGGPRGVIAEPTCVVSSQVVATGARSLDTALSRFAISCKGLPTLTLKFAQRTTTCGGISGTPGSDWVEVDFDVPAALTTTAMQWVTAHELTHLLSYALSNGTNHGSEGLADWGASAVWHSEWGQVNRGPFAGQYFTQYLGCLAGQTSGCMGSTCSLCEFFSYDPRSWASSGRSCGTGNICGLTTTNCCCWWRDAEENYYESLLGLDPAKLERLDFFAAYGCPGDIVRSDASVTVWRGVSSVDDGATDDIRSPSVAITVLPNPARSIVNVRFETLGSVLAARLEVFDVVGREVFTRPLGDLLPGIHSMTWDGVGDDGSPRPAGLYFVRVASPGMNSRTVKTMFQ